MCIVSVVHRVERSLWVKLAVRHGLSLETDMCSGEFGRMGMGNSGNGLTMTSYFIQSLIVLKMFVKLSKWQVPPDGFVMRLQSQWLICWVLQCGQSTLLLIAHCGLSARLGQPAVQHELVLDVNEKEALKCQCCTSWDCHSADDLSKYNRPKTWKRSCGPHCTLLCIYTSWREGLQHFFLKVSKV